MNLDFWIGLFTGAIATVVVIFMLEGVSGYLEKKRRKIKDEWK